MPRTKDEKRPPPSDDARPRLPNGDARGHGAGGFDRDSTRGKETRKVGEKRKKRGG